MTTTTDPTKLSRIRLAEIAETVGLPVSSRESTDGLRDRIRAHVESAAAFAAAAADPSSPEAQKAARIVSIGASEGFVSLETPVADALESRPATETSAAAEEPEEIEGEVVSTTIACPICGDPMPDGAIDCGKDACAAELYRREKAGAAAESTALALREEPVSTELALLPSAAEFHAMREMAAAVASTQMVPVAYHGKPDDVLAAILTGRELGIGPMQSLRDIYVVDGKPSLAANLLLARLRTGGIVILESESNMDRAWIRARRRDTGEIAEVEWTYEEAKTITYRKKGGATALLVEKDNWTNYRPDMLWARCVGRLARRLGPDLIGGAMPYTSEEVADWDDASADSGATPTGYGTDKKGGQWVEPADWRELVERLIAHLGADETPIWTAQIATIGYAKKTLRDVVNAEDVDADRKRDLWTRMKAILRALDVEGETRLRPDHRALVAGIISHAFDDAIVVEGPPWSLGGPDEEASGRPVRGVQEQGPTEGATAASEPQAAAVEPSERLDVTPDGEEIKF